MKLYQHQIDALEKTKDYNRCAYYLDMGLGKTFIGSEKANSLHAQYTLVICQKSKVNDWLNHFNEYYDCRLYDLTKKKDLFNYLHDTPIENIPMIGIINYDLVWRRKELINLKNFTLMLDESSLIANERSKRSS